MSLAQLYIYMKYTHTHTYAHTEFRASSFKMEPTPTEKADPTVCECGLCVRNSRSLALTHIQRDSEMKQHARPSGRRSKREREKKKNQLVGRSWKINAVWPGGAPCMANQTHPSSAGRCSQHSLAVLQTNKSNVFRAGWLVGLSFILSPSFIPPLCLTVIIT